MLTVDVRVDGRCGTGGAPFIDDVDVGADEVSVGTEETSNRLVAVLKREMMQRWKVDVPPAPAPAPASSQGLGGDAIYNDVCG